MDQRKLSAAEKAAKERRRREYQTVFMNGKMKRIRRPPTIDGISVDAFIRANADVIFLHQEGLLEYPEETGVQESHEPPASVTTSSAREPVSAMPANLHGR